jgi:NAD(P)-dependent dehydrogenase (short-subunit alcohol dehydrogenase family)
MNWKDPNWVKSYDKWQAYDQSKLANVLHANELARRLEETGISVYSLHPGRIRTKRYRVSTKSFPVFERLYMRNALGV